MGLLYEAWSVIQISEHGEYSQERWQALQLYQQRTSAARALAVCLLTPLPSLILVIGLESLPLSPIADGWKIMSTLSARLFGSAIVMAFCVLNLSRRFIPELKIKPRNLVIPAIITGIFHVSFLFGYTELWVFPLPFAIAQTSGVFSSFCILSFILCLGTAPFRDVPDIKRRLTLFLSQLAILTVLSMGYPGYGAFYRQQHGLTQAFVVVLPVLAKLLVKALLAKIGHALGCDEFIPEIAHCGIELLHTLFISSCVQTTTQPLQIALIVVVFDFLPLVQAFRHISTTIHSKSRASIAGIASLARVFPASLSLPSQPEPKRSTAKGPVGPTSQPRGNALSTKTQARRALYMCENHLLVEYFECAIPVSYTIYVIVLFYLPNAQYYETMRTIQTPTRLAEYIETVLILVLLQLLSLVVFSMMISRRVLPSISSLHQLSFVLETQAEMVQMWFFTWMPLCILSTVAHGGMDFTMRLEWIKNKHTT